MNQQNQSYCISSQFTEVNFEAFFFLTVYIYKDREDHSRQVEPGREGLRVKSLSCQIKRLKASVVHVASTEAELGSSKVQNHQHKKQHKDSMPGSSLETALNLKRSGKMRKEMLKSSLKLTGDKWNIVLSQMGKLHHLCSSAENRH